MIFIINGLKYDTDKMDLLSDKTRTFVKAEGFELDFARRINGDNGDYGRYVDSKIYVSKKGNYLEVFEKGGYNCGRAISEKEAKEKLTEYDFEKCEEIFGEYEEA